VKPTRGDNWSTWERRIRAEERATGAERERRRIRAKQRGWVHVVRGFIATVPVTSAANALALDALSRIDAATGAPRAKRRRGT